jgi:glutathione S-transferase
MQPPVMPRPDLEAIGVKYRRIPIMTIGRNVYCDTRLILDKLEQLFPGGTLGVSQPDQRAVQKLLEKWTIDAGIFTRASQLIPTNMPLLNDSKFTKDREDFSGRSWNKKQMEAMRPEAIAHIREGFAFLERTLLADDREWILKTEKPSLADIEGGPHSDLRLLICWHGGRAAIWAFDWLNGLNDALPKDLISEKQYPKVFGWMQRFNGAIKAAKAAAPKPTTLKGAEAASRVLGAKYAESEARIDEQDPTNLKHGEEVEIWPIDTGFRHRDRGLLVGINEEEIVLQLHPKPREQEIRLHFPRTNFRIQAVQAGESKL